MGWDNRGHGHAVNDLTDVDAPSPADGQALVWDNANSEWVPGDAGSSSPLTTKGDLYTYDTADARLPVGTDGQHLTADSSAATGLAWADLDDGAYAETIGDGSTTSFAVTHSLGTEDVQVQVWDVSGTDPVLANGDPSSVTATDTNTVTVAFGSAPSTDQYRVVVLASGASGGGGGASGVTVAATDTATGASPHSVSTTGVQSGDVALFVMTSRNSIIDVNGPEGGGWTKLWHVDVSSDEECAAWFKVCSGAEPSTWEWTHGSGTTVISGVVIYRGIDGTAVHWGLNSSRTCPVILGSETGIHLVVAHSCFDTTAGVTITDPASLLTIDLDHDNSDQGMAIGRRDAQFPAAQPPFSFTGGDSRFVGTGAAVLE